jgi:hypothetical protein
VQPCEEPGVGRRLQQRDIDDVLCLRHRLVESIDENVRMSKTEAARGIAWARD